MKQTIMRLCAVLLAVVLVPAAAVFAEEDASYWTEIEAESVSVASPVVMQSDAAASGGLYIVAPEPGNVGTADGSVTAAYSFTVDETDAYSIWLRAKAPHRYADSFFFSLDNSGEAYELLTVSPQTTEWKWYNIKTRVLSPGSHTFIIKYRERAFAMDKFVVTDGWSIVPAGKGSRSEAVTDMPQTDIDTAQLNEYANVHPRLLVDADRVSEIQSSIGTDARYASIWQEVKSVADGFAAAEPPAYYLSSGLDDGWQRSVGYKTASLAAAYLFSGDEKYSAAAQRWALASCSYPTWGREHYEGIDLAASHQLFALSLVYDWCYDALDADARDTIRDTILLRGKQLYVSVRADWRTYWMSQRLQNHFYIGLNALGTAGMAVFDIEPAAVSWVQEAVDGYRLTFDTLASDGASLEGFGYWTYGLESMLAFCDNARRLVGEDFFSSPWLRNTAAYAAALTLPEEAWSPAMSHVDIADSDRDNSQFTGPDYQLRKLAGEYGDGRIQTLANQLNDANLTYTTNNWYNLIWYDPSVAEAPISELPTFAYFDDLGLVSARSDRDGSESMLVYKNGPYAGHKASEMRAGQSLPDWGAGHVHPDANSFVLFGNGEYLLRDDGYSPKYTQNHNTLLIDGEGQLGEGSTWFNYSSADEGGAPEIYTAYSTPALDYMVGDAAAAYAADSGLAQYTRHLIYLKPDMLLVVDEVETTGAHDVELRFFPEGQSLSQSGGVLTFTGGSSRLSAATLSGGGNFRAEDVTIRTGRSNGTDETRKTIRATKTVNGSWVNITAFAWSDSGSTPVLPTLLSESGGVYRFAADGRTFVLDVNAKHAYEEADHAQVVYDCLLSDGKQVSSSQLEAGDTVSAQAYVTASAGETETATLILALKQGEVLADVAVQTAALDTDQPGVLLETNSIILPDDFGDGWQLEIYVWDSLAGMRPLPRA